MTIIEMPVRPGRYAEASRPGGPTVSLVIPAFNEASTIERCLLAAVGQTRAPWEIVVVDNRSTDATAEIVERVAAEHPEVPIRLVRQYATQGLVPTRNLGFAVATGEVFGRIDADTVLDPRWVERVADSMRDAAVGAVTGPVVYYDLPVLGTTQVSDDLVRRALRGLGRRYPFLYGSNMAIRAEAWRAIEHATCLDQDDLLHEDIDLAVHLRQAHIRTAYVPRMRASVSARRLGSSPSSFRAYTTRFEATYDAHEIRHWSLRAPQLLLQLLYWTVRPVRQDVP